MDKQIEKFEFRVIDNNTGEEADIEEIAFTEDWAEGLIYCDMEGFAILEDGSLVLLDEFGNCAYCPSGRFSIIPENAVVLTANEQVDRWIDLLVEFDEMGFEPTTLPPKEMSAEEYAAFWKDRVVKFFVNARKETAEKFAERFKAHLKQSYHNLYHSEYREGMVSINLDTLIENIDEICKELVDEK